jgi:hypothetical protein
MLLSWWEHCLALHRFLLNPRKFKISQLRIQPWLYSIYALPCSELNKGCKNTHNLTWTWISLNRCQSTIVLHHWCFPDENHLTDHRCGRDDAVQPIYTWPCEGGALNIVYCPRFLLALDHPLSVESPIEKSFSKFCLHCLHLLCAWVDSLGHQCISVYFAEQLSVVCKTMMLLLPDMDHPTLLVVIIQAGLLKWLKTAASSS